MRKRAVAYARVSSNSASQEHSFEFQKEYWDRKLSNDPNYEYVGLYADRGISGKFANRRPQFQLMLSAIKSGNVDIVFTKSVQRFARNTEELLTIVRELRELGVGVFFEKENINTLTNDNDLFLTIAVAVAEDDLSRYSQNVVWSIQDKFKKGHPVVNGRIYGYSMGKGKGDSFRIIESEALIVNRIFELYLYGNSVTTISDILNQEKIPSPLGKTWHQSCIDRILRNEKYVGDCLLQKYYREKWNSKVTNKGVRDKYLVENHHDPIVSRELFDKVQEMIKQRSNHKLIGRIIKPFPFTGLIICGDCGKHYRHKVSKSFYSKDFDVWMCNSKKDVCHSVRVKDDELKQRFVEAYNEFILMKYQGNEEKLIQDEIDALISQKNELDRLKSNGWISLTQYQSEIDKIIKPLSIKKGELSALKLRKLSEKDFRVIESFDESKVEKFLSKIVISGININFHFYNGVVVTRTIQNTRIYDKDKKLLGIKEE